MDQHFRFAPPANERVLGYLPGSAEKAALKRELQYLVEHPAKATLVIGGKKITTEATGHMRCPHNHELKLGTYCQAGAKEVQMAIDAALAAKPAWEAMPWTERARIFKKAAALLAGPWRARLNAATMLGQSKNAYQAEIDSACELIDFWNCNTSFMGQIYGDQPASNPDAVNAVDYRPLEGFVFAVTPFNFTAIAGNLPTAPAMMGNVVLWKPAASAMLSAHYIMELLHEAGLPDGVINFIPGPSSVLSDSILKHKDLAGVHFTGSTEVFEQIWRTTAEHVGNYTSYPRLVGETGGKDFVFAHPDCDVRGLSVALVRGAFEYQGQKCSAASRAYIPASLWPKVKTTLTEELNAVRMGDVSDFRTFMGAVIDEKSFTNIAAYIDKAKHSNQAEIIYGGVCDRTRGWFVEPTVILAKDPHFTTMCEEIFGPVLTVYVYDDAKLAEALEICNKTSPYALTGAIFARDRGQIAMMEQALRHAAGNFYINDKPTGAVVGQQPFGGGRKSGTNDKAGSALNLLRWTSPRTVKETFASPHTVTYPYMTEA